MADNITITQKGDDPERRVVECALCGTRIVNRNGLASAKGLAKRLAAMSCDEHKADPREARRG